MCFPAVSDKSSGVCLLVSSIFHIYTNRGFGQSVCGSERVNNTVAERITNHDSALVDKPGHESDGVRGGGGLIEAWLFLGCKHKFDVNWAIRNWLSSWTQIGTRPGVKTIKLTLAD